jgi:hypothetical protein
MDNREKVAINVPDEVIDAATVATETVQSRQRVALGPVGKQCASVMPELPTTAEAGARVRRRPVGLARGIRRDTKALRRQGQRRDQESVRCEGKPTQTACRPRSVSATGFDKYLRVDKEKWAYLMRPPAPRWSVGAQAIGPSCSCAGSDYRFEVLCSLRRIYEFSS